MNKESIDEMEQIQKGLEEFLEKEVKGYHGEGESSQEPQYEAEEYGKEPPYQAQRYVQEPQYEAEKHGKEPTYQTKRYAQEPQYEAEKYTETDRQRYQETVKGEDSSMNDKGSAERGRKKKKKKRKSLFRRLFTFLLVLCVIIGGLGYFAVGLFYGKLNYERIDSVAASPMKEEGVTNILLIGNDSRSEGEDGRSDAMILLSISNKTKKIYMTSLLRDMYVEIPGYKDNRLNAAYAYGGPELLMETLEKNLDITVNRYVLVNFQAFANLVDAVGGVDLELTNDEVIYVNGYLVEYNILEGRAEGTDYLDTSLSGMIHLNGPQALAYCRNRYLGTDFGRTERQRKVLTAVIKNAPKALVTNPKGLVDGLLPNLTTNLTQAECYALSLQAAKALTYEIVAASIPIEGSYSNATIRQMSVLQVDFEKNKAYIRENIYGKVAE